MGEFLTTENDTIRLVYAFWDENGRMGVFIHNKSDKPLYIDWKKCSFLVEDEKNDYWQDVTSINTSWNSTASGSSESKSSSETKDWFSQFMKELNGFYESSAKSTSSGKSVSTWQMETFSSLTSIITKPERITFIPPRATICKAEILNNQ